MLGFSFSKLIVLLIIIVVVWHGFKVTRKWRQNFTKESLERKNNFVNATPENMEKCSVCATFVPISVAKSCGRNSCPY
ncbi:MAG: hypothetical protein CMM53_02185 [Rhodospirillaceae bacterium]|nr:hypothetical protein [Rhodospirillaceae bacterium]